MLKIEEVLKQLEEVDRVLKSVDEMKIKILSQLDEVAKKHSNTVAKKIEEVVNATISEYRTKAIEETKKEVDKIYREAEERRRKILEKYQQNKAKLVQQVLQFLNL
ncbi:MAG: hypothetical protein ABWK05_07970 [Pyrobaculum sp.]